jgi:hypothetical protein
MADGFIVISFKDCRGVAKSCRAFVTPTGLVGTAPNATLQAPLEAGATQERTL